MTRLTILSLLLAGCAIEENPDAKPDAPPPAVCDGDCDGECDGDSMEGWIDGDPWRPAKADDPAEPEPDPPEPEPEPDPPPPDAGAPIDDVDPVPDAGPPDTEPLDLPPDAGPPPIDAAPDAEWEEWPDAAPPDAAPEPEPEPDCRPRLERCNGLDDDCDGEIDEDTGGAVCFRGTGGCQRQGWEYCDEIHGRLACDAPDPPRATPEICGDGEDNDCDGEYDEGCR